MRLSHRDFDAFQNASLELYDRTDLNTFWQAVPSVLLRLFPRDYFLYNKFRIDLPSMQVELLEVVESTPRMTPSVRAALAQHVLKHPFTEYFLKSGDRTALKTSDFFPLRKFQRTVFHEQAQEPLGLDYTLSVALDAAPGTAAALNIGAKGRDFTERDRLMLNLIQPHFDRAHQNAQLATARRAAGARPLSEYALSPRETEVANWMAAGKTNPEIALILTTSVRTVEKQVARIIEKLGVENRTAAALTIANTKRA